METKEMIEKVEKITNITEEITGLKEMMIRNCGRVNKKFEETGKLTIEYFIKFINAQLGIIDKWASKLKEIQNISNSTDEYFPGKRLTNIFIVSECKNILRYKNEYSEMTRMIIEKAELETLNSIVEIMMKK